MNTHRSQEIDTLRGISMLAMILIHTNAYFLSFPFVHFLWNSMQFAVPVFIFCSAYLFFQKQTSLTFSTSLNHIKKRVSRLLIPYYLLLPFWFLIIYFSEPQKMDKTYIFQNLFLTGGMDINWLVVLFLYFAFLMPFIGYLKERNDFVLLIFALASSGSSFFFLFHTFPYSYKLIMWLPWSLVIFFSLFFVMFEKQKWFYPITLVTTGLLFILTYTIQVWGHHSLIHYYNKYPPNLYHLSYGLFFITFLFFLAKRKVFWFAPIQVLLQFLSKHSYPLYFIHYFIIFIITLSIKSVKFGWIDFFLTVLILSIAAQSALNTLYNFVFSLRKSVIAFQH